MLNENKAISELELLYLNRYKVENKTVYIQKVLQTARLPVTKGKGSELERGLSATVLRGEFSQKLDEKFEAQGFATLDDIQENIKKKNPSIDVTVKKLNFFQSLLRSGHLKQLRNETGQIKGFELAVEPLYPKNILRKDDPSGNESVVHEFDHLATAVTEPKYLAAQAGELPKRKDRAQYKEYKATIYSDELNHLFSFNEAKLRNAPEARINAIKAKIEKLFKKKAFSPEEKIKTLRNWKYSIKDEPGAYKRGIDAYMKAARASEFPVWGLNKMNENTKYDKLVRQRFFFPEKLKLIESMLLDEITKVRTEQAFRKSQKISEINYTN